MAQYVIGDIHGGLRALEQLLERVPFRNNDQLIFLGDYLDGWSQGPEVIDTLTELNNRFDCRFIRGNHDALCLDYLKHGKAPKQWVLHGGQSSIDAYHSCTSEKITRHISFLEELENYVEDSGTLFVHAGFSHPKGPSEEFHAHLVYWDRSLWETASPQFERSRFMAIPRTSKALQRNIHRSYTRPAHRSLTAISSVQCVEYRYWCCFSRNIKLLKYRDQRILAERSLAQSLS
jgi:serine/threonine protein phosphatase 1